MINFKVTCDRCRREVSTLDAVVFHDRCVRFLLEERMPSDYDNYSTQEFANFLPKVSEAELMSDAL